MPILPPLSWLHKRLPVFAGGRSVWALGMAIAVLGTGVGQPAWATTFTRPSDEVLVVAAQAGMEGLLAERIRNGAYVDSCDHRRRTALMLAVRHNNLLSVGQLLKSGADAEKVDLDGNTATMWAVRRGHMEALHMILAHLEGSPARDRQLRRALEIAQQYADVPIEKALREVYAKELAGVPPRKPEPIPVDHMVPTKGWLGGPPKNAAPQAVYPLPGQKANVYAPQLAPDPYYLERPSVTLGIGGGGMVVNPGQSNPYATPAAPPSYPAPVQPVAPPQMAPPTLDQSLLGPAPGTFVPAPIQPIAPLPAAGGQPGVAPLSDLAPLPTPPPSLNP